MSSDHAMPPMGHQDMHGRDGVSSNNNRLLLLLRDIIRFTHNSTTGKDNTKSSKLLRRYIDTNDDRRDELFEEIGSPSRRRG
jgi:hypothetical protein